MGTVFTKLRLFFHKISFIINTVFLPSSETVSSSHVGALHAHGASPSRILQKYFLRVHPSGGGGGYNKEIRQVLNRNSKEDLGKQWTALLQ